MANYDLSKTADEEIALIYEFSVLNFGLYVAQEYFYSLHACFASLADFPDMGRVVQDAPKGVRALLHRKHTIFYKQIESGVLIVHIFNTKQENPPKDL